MTDTIETAIAFLTGVLAETRETLSRTDPDLRQRATRNAAQLIEVRLLNRSTRRAAFTFAGSSRSMVWHAVAVSVAAPEDDPLAIFDAWLAKATAEVTAT